MRPDATIAEVRRHLAAPPERVFGAFADARLVSRWLSPAPEIALTVLRFDFRVGGAYRLAYAVPLPSYLLIETAFTLVQWLMVGPLAVLAFHDPVREDARLRIAG